jgi:polyisoprenoid-binding protein YceI
MLPGAKPSEAHYLIQAHIHQHLFCTMKNLAPCLRLPLLSLTALPLVHAQQKLLPAQSEIVFVSKQMGVPVEGRFKRFDAQIQL